MLRETLLSSAPEEKPKPSRETLVSSSSSASSGKKAMPPTRKLEITSISAEALLDGRKPVKKNAFVAFEIAENHCNGAIARTRADEVGGDYPAWEDKLEMEFSLPCKKESFMYVGVYCEVGVGKDKKVGTARVPLKDFTGGGYAPEGFLHCLSYRLWDEYGKRNGIVNFSARIVPDKKGAGTRSFWLK